MSTTTTFNSTTTTAVYQTPPTPTPFGVVAEEDSADTTTTLLWVPGVIGGCMVLLIATAFLVYQQRRSSHHDAATDHPPARRFSKSRRNSTQKGLKLIPTNERADFGESTAIFENIDSNMTIYSELNESHTGSQALSNISFRAIEELNKYSATIDQVLSDAENQVPTGSLGTGIVPFSNQSRQSQMERLINVVKSSESLASRREAGVTVVEIREVHDDRNQNFSVNESIIDDIVQEAGNEMLRASAENNEAANFVSEGEDDGIDHEAADEDAALNASAANYVNDECDDMDQEDVNEAAKFASEGQGAVEEITGNEETAEEIVRHGETVELTTAVSNTINSGGRNEINDQSND